jgi:O-antigen/teichoic acid export membrane protein
MSAVLQTAESRAKERRRRVLLTAGTAAAVRGANMLTLLISVPLVLGYLGAEQFGVWMALIAITALLGFADLGLGNGLVNAVAAADGRDDGPAAARLAVSSAFVMIAAAAGALGVAFFLSYQLVPWADLVNASGTEAAGLVPSSFAALAVCVLAALPAGLVQRVQIGLQQGFEANAWAMLGGPFALAALFIAIQADASLPWLVAAFAGGPVIASAANSVNYFVRRHPELRPTLRDFRRSEARRLLSLGLGFFIVQAAGVAAYQSGVLVIAHVLGPTQVANYSIPLQLFLAVPVVLNLFLMPLWPAYGESIARGDVAWARRALLRSISLALAISAPAAVVLAIAAPSLIDIWVGDRVEPSGALLVALAVWIVVVSVSSGIAMFLNGAGLIRLQAILATAMAIASVVLSLALTQRFGISGAVWGPIVGQCVFVLIPLGVLTPRLIARLNKAEFLPATAGA